MAKSIAKQILELLPNEKDCFVLWKTSYFYLTKTNARKGGSNRIRETWWYIDNNGKPTKTFNPYSGFDELTGKFFLKAYETLAVSEWSIPVPRVFMEHPNLSFSVMRLGWHEEILVEKITGLRFMGNEESAQYLSAHGNREAIPIWANCDQWLTSLECKYIPWDLFFSYKELKKLFVPSTIQLIEVFDGEVKKKLLFQPTFTKDEDNRDFVLIKQQLK